MLYQTTRHWSWDQKDRATSLSLCARPFRERILNYYLYVDFDADTGATHWVKMIWRFGQQILTNQVDQELRANWNTYLDSARAYYGNATGLKNPLVTSRALESDWKTILSRLHLPSYQGVLWSSRNPLLVDSRVRFCGNEEWMRPIYMGMAVNKMVAIQNQRAI